MQLGAPLVAGIAFLAEPLLKLGNMRLKDLKVCFERNASSPAELLKEHSFIILEAGRIRILE